MQGPKINPAASVTGSPTVYRRHIRPDGPNISRSAQNSQPSPLVLACAFAGCPALASQANQFGRRLMVLRDTAESPEFTVDEILNIRLDGQPYQFHQAVLSFFILYHVRLPYKHSPKEYCSVPANIVANTSASII